MKSFYQILAIASIEFRFGVRRGWPVVGTIAVLFVMGGSTLVFTYLNMEGLPAQYAPSIGGDALVMIWGPFNVLALGVLTMACAPSIPADRQIGIYELIRSMPITGSRYLLGKVMGTVAAVVLTGAIMLAIFLGLHWMLAGPVNIPLYVEVILFSGLPVLTWAPTLGVISAVGINKRFSAVFVGLIAGLFGLLPWGWFAQPPAHTIDVMGSTSAWINRFIAHVPINDWIWSRYGWKDVWWPPVSENIIVLTYITAFLILLAIGLLARSWLLWKENF